MRFYADGEGGFQTAAARVRGARNAYRLAREFGRGRAYALWLAARYLVTGRTSRYRIRLTPRKRHRSAGGLMRED